MWSKYIFRDNLHPEEQYGKAADGTRGKKADTTVDVREVPQGILKRKNDGSAAVEKGTNKVKFVTAGELMNQQNEKETTGKGAGKKKTKNEGKKVSKKSKNAKKNVLRNGLNFLVSYTHSFYNKNHYKPCIDKILLLVQVERKGSRRRKIVNWTWRNVPKENRAKIRRKSRSFLRHQLFGDIRDAYYQK